MTELATDLTCAPVIEIPADEVAVARAAGVEADNVGLAVMRLIRDYGVDTVFGIPGTHNLELYRHVRRLGLRAVTSRHEQGAGYAAFGWTQRTGLPGVVITTYEPNGEVQTGSFETKPPSEAELERREKMEAGSW